MSICITMKIKGGRGNDVLVAGEGKINRITSIGGNDIIFAGNGKEIYDIRGKGHRFIVGLTPDELNGDQIIGQFPMLFDPWPSLGRLSSFARATRIGNNLLFGNGDRQSTITIVDYFSHKNAIDMKVNAGSGRRNSTLFFNDQHYPIEEITTFAPFAFEDYRFMVNNLDFYKDISNSKMFKDIDEITKSYVDSLNV